MCIPFVTEDCNMIFIYHTISHNIVINDIITCPKAGWAMGIVTPPFIGIVIAIL